MSRSRRKRKRAGKQRGQGKLTAPTPAGPDTTPVGASDAAVAESALPVESAEQLVGITHTQSIELSAGPLPHPRFFQAYDDTLPGAAHRILTMAERQQEHRHARQSVRLASDASRETRGQWMAFAIVIVALIGGFTLIAFDKTIGGVTTALGAIGGIAGVFIWSRRHGAGGSHPDPPPLPESPAGPPTTAD